MNDFYFNVCSTAEHFIKHSTGTHEVFLESTNISKVLKKICDVLFLVKSWIEIDTSQIYLGALQTIPRNRGAI